ncbi:MAG: HAD family hydrolase [Mogibacterium sp.]|nr:HAD family hydrolase [Mogibacterium sp.]
MKRLIIFDLDGTLWDSSEQVAASWNIALAEETGREWHMTAADIAQNMGLTMDQIADNLFPEYEAEERYALARRCEVFENEYISIHGARLYNGVRETLERLHGSGALMAVVSNCQKDYVKAFLDSMKMHELFIDYEEWGRSGLLKADNISLVMRRNDIDAAVYVGDIQADADASARAGIPCIWASYGFGHIDEPAAVLDSFDRLPALLTELGFM